MSLTPLSLSSGSHEQIEGFLSVAKKNNLTSIANDALKINEPVLIPLAEIKVDDHPDNTTQNKTEELISHTHVKTQSKTLSKKNKSGLFSRDKKIKIPYSYSFGDERSSLKITLDVVRNLRNTYNCLIQAHTQNDVKLVLNRKGFLELTSGSMTEEEKMFIQQDIYMNIISALQTGIYHFFDDKGHFIDLKAFERLVRLNFEFDSFIQENAVNAFEAYYPKTKLLFEDENKLKKFLEKLCIPEGEAGKLSEHEIFCIGILQRLYPENTDFKQHKTAVLSTLPVFPPSVFLMAYKQFVTTPQLLKIIQTVLEWPKKFIPTFQKVRLMNFLRTLIETFSYRFEIKKHKDEVKKILEVGRKINSEAMFIASEIEERLEAKALPKKQPGVNKLADFLKTGLDNHSNAGQYYLKMIDYIAEDLKILTAESMNSLTIEELYSDKKTANPSHFIKHEDHLVNFIYSLFDAGNVEASLRFCFHLAAASLEKNDYFTSYVIYTCLSSAEIGNLYHTKKKNSHLPHLLKKSKKVDLDTKTLEIYQELSALFSLSSNRVKMNREILECNKRNILVIPEITLIKSSLIRMADEFSAHQDEIKINMKEIDIQTLHDTSDYKMKVESIMNNVLLFYQHSPDLQTDIGTYIDLL